MSRLREKNNNVKAIIKKEQRPDTFQDLQITLICPVVTNHMHRNMVLGKR